MPKKPFLEAGQIVGTHGVRGELRVQPWCDGPEQLMSMRVFYWDEQGKAAVRGRARAHKTIALLTLDGVTTVEQAQALRGRVLYVKREDFQLPEGRYFICDLIGASVVDAASGEVYGTLTDVSATGANDIYHMRTARGEVLIPAVPSIVKSVDIDSGVVKIEPIKGLLDDED